jgi:hypothetical protein
VPLWITATHSPCLASTQANSLRLRFNPFFVCDFRRHPYTINFSIVAGRNPRISHRMEGFGLPMSFGKKAKAGTVNMKAKLEKTRRDEVGVFSLLIADRIADPLPPLEWES